MKITKTDPFTGEENTMEIDVTPLQLQLWESGELIQDVMPNLTPDEREFIKTGITPESWDSMYGDDDIKTLDQWFITGRGGPYEAPELHQYCLAGVRPDGKSVTTSRIVGHEGELILTASGSRYRLLKPEPLYDRRYPQALRRLIATIDRGMEASHKADREHDEPRQLANDYHISKE